MHNKEHHFNFLDFETVIAKFSEVERKKLASNEDNARFILIAEMYLQRFPYID